MTVLASSDSDIGAATGGAGRVDGESRVRVSGLGLGTAPLGNLYAEVSETEAHEALACALESGIRYFDTAPYYGHGLAERRLGDVLGGIERDRFMVSTKVGRRIEPDSGQHAALVDGFAVHGSRAIFDYSRDGVKRSFEASLERLGLDRVDVLLLHDVGRLTHGEHHPQMLRQALDEALPAMAELRDAGTVGAIGIGVNEVEVCMELMPRFDLDCIMLAGRYTLFEQASALAMLDQARQRRVEILAAGPYNSGLLGSSQGPGKTYNYEPASAATLQRANEIYAICASEGVDVSAAALQFPLGHPAVAAVVVGVRSTSEVENALERIHHGIPGSAWKHLQAKGIIVADAPFPASGPQS